MWSLARFFITAPWSFFFLNQNCSHLRIFDIFHKVSRIRLPFHLNLLCIYTYIFKFSFCLCFAIELRQFKEVWILNHMTDTIIVPSDVLEFPHLVILIKNEKVNKASTHPWKQDKSDHIPVSKHTLLNSQTCCESYILIR